MNKFDKQFIKKLGKSLMFEIEDEQCEKIGEELTTFIEQLAIFEQIDTEGVEAMSFPYQLDENSYLREDQAFNQLTTEEGLSNVQFKEDNYVKVKKVVK